MPFDTLGTGYAPCRSDPNRLRFLLCEARKVTRKLKGRFPEDYLLSVVEDKLSALSQKQTEYAVQAHPQLQSMPSEPAQVR